MAESSIHTTLVKLLAKWITELLPSEDSSHMLVDALENPSQKKPPKLYEFVPDIFVPNVYYYTFIIGEAKIATDIDNKHTEEQLTAFLQKCSECNNALLVLAVPWHKVRLARSVIKYCKKKIGLDAVETEVIERLPG
jgi:hypothetical protein